MSASLGASEAAASASFVWRCPEEFHSLFAPGDSVCLQQGVTEVFVFSIDNVSFRNGLVRRPLRESAVHVPDMALPCGQRLLPSQLSRSHYKNRPALRRLHPVQMQGRPVCFQMSTRGKSCASRARCSKRLQRMTSSYDQRRTGWLNPAEVTSFCCRFQL